MSGMRENVQLQRREGAKRLTGSTGNHFVVLGLDGHTGSSHLGDLCASCFGSGKKFQIPWDPSEILPQFPAGLNAASGLGCALRRGAPFYSKGHLQCLGDGGGVQADAQWGSHQKQTADLRG